MKKIIALILKNVIKMFVRCTVYEIWFFFILLFGVHQLFCYVVCEYLHNVDEAASYLPLFCYRPVSLPGVTCSAQRTFYSATSILKKCKKVVLEKWFFKLGFFFLVNHFSRTRFLEPDFSNQISRTTFLHFSRKEVAE